ncbi:MAG: Rne/Rng family ribonuclease [Verrucomicrobia bacterium]|nr:Rne/Rng family ribonuclease [bacterium]NDA09670.1 Rne/Rng family ribonuclease [Verrucomicrobiota bacterium]NDA25544.1 Rne/Rng family ribonuclease [Verrucomicrobiota bacterium]NDD56345.1 Rne/Rng family ribonuclease [Verrucomicrobiota bacterium]NDD81094.1 Rne/Rng family ribonuclease [Verrucomicrobiota bacterium]
MILETIKRLFRGKSREERRSLLISVEPLEKRVALLEGGVVEEFSIEREGDRSISGNIYKARVHNVEGSLKALFVDIGQEKNAFLHFWDAVPAAMDEQVEAVERRGGRARKPRITSNDIPKLYPAGADVIVQVNKGPIGTKGARVTTNISLPGRYLVLMPFGEMSGVSRKIENPEERARLRKILQDLDIPDGMGVILRTNGEGMQARYFVRDLALLLEQWRRVEEGMKTKTAPAVLLEEPDLVERSVRDFLTEEVDEVVVDNDDADNRVRNLVGLISKRSLRKVKRHLATEPLFEAYGVNRQIESALRRQVWLKSGASLVIDETEALVSIDVNTGKTRGGKDHDDTIRKTNLEAAEEIARQLRLRNLGGLIVIDFIDMRSRKDQNAVYEKFKECLRRDRARTHTLPISPLGLLEMTRQRVQESIRRAVYMECPSCRGKGMVKSHETMSVEIQREISRLLRKHPDVHEIKVVVHPGVLHRLRTEDDELLVELQRRCAGKFSFKADPSANVEDFKIVNAATEQPLE